MGKKLDVLTFGQWVALAAKYPPEQPAPASDVCPQCGRDTLAVGAEPPCWVCISETWQNEAGKDVTPTDGSNSE